MFTDIDRRISCLDVDDQVETGTSWVMGLHYHIHGHECNEGRCMRHVNYYSREISLVKLIECIHITTAKGLFTALSVHVLILHIGLRSTHWPTLREKWSGDFTCIQIQDRLCLRSRRDFDLKSPPKE